ncbi:MAG: transcriptional regulator [Hafnia sp.]
MKRYNSRQITSGIGDVMRVLKVSCPVCDAKAKNYGTHWQNEFLANLYYICTNPKCNMRFGFCLDSFRVISPSDLRSDGVVKALLQRLNPEEKQMALELLQHQ